MTTDSWSSRDGIHSLLSLACHFIHDGEPKFVVLCAKPIKGRILSHFIILFYFLGRHTSEVLKTLIKCVLDEYDIPESKIFLILRDAAEVMIKVCTDLGVKSYDCFAHKLNLVSFIIL